MELYCAFKIDIAMVWL